jgi:hypothetical protein
VIEIRSFRRVFDLERRVYSVDRFRLNPAGVPVRGILYVLVALLVAVIAAKLPLIGRPLRLLPWYLRDVGGPGAIAALLAVIRVDGRSFHLAAHAGIGWGLAPRRVAGLSIPSQADRPWHPPELIVLPDGSDHRLRRLRFSGPGAVLVLAAHRLVGGDGRSAGLPGRTTVRLGPNRGSRPERGIVIALERGGRLEVSAADEDSAR